MPETQTIIHDALERARRDWEAYVFSEEQQLLRIYEQAHLKVNTLLLQSSGAEGTVKIARLQFLNKAIQRELTVLRRRINTIVTRSMRNSINVALEDMIKSSRLVLSDRKVLLGTAFFDKFGNLHRWNPKKQLYPASMWAGINYEALDFLKKYRPHGLTLSQELWNITWVTQRNLMNRIGVAVVTGEKTATLARDIENLLGVAEGRKLTTRGKLSVLPGRGIYRDSYKNAMRVARTELSRAYIEGQHRYIAVKPWIIGVIHRIGGPSPCEECQDLVGTFYPKGEYSEIPVHPHCMCYEEQVIDERYR
jgi:hypothetical protein